MPQLELVIGSKNWSSWSLRPWLLLTELGIPFEETLIQLRQPDTACQIGEKSPSGWVPVLIVDGTPIWDSLAIAEFVAEQEPSAWPSDRMMRAHARCVAAEMHSGFATLRSTMPMMFAETREPHVDDRARIAADVARIETIWLDCRQRHAAAGPFLFGGFTIADAMFAPVASRFRTYGVKLAPPAQAYAEAVMALPGMKRWEEGARAELGR